MDLYDESRTLVHSGPLSRRQRSELDWYGWIDLTVALLDNYRQFLSRHTPRRLKLFPFGVVILMREETRPNGFVKRHVVSRVIHLCTAVTYLN